VQNPTDTMTIKDHSICFEDVHFQYDDALQPALQHIDFCLEPGKTLALLGRVGSGKTTLINLIGRLYDTSSGKVTIGKVDVRQADLSELRQAIAYVPQEAFLFSDTFIVFASFAIDVVLPEPCNPISIMTVSPDG